MTDTVHSLIEQYGLLAVFLGCLLQAESAAVFGGFFSHQGLVDPVATLVVVFAGAFLGDVGLFLVGRHYVDHPKVLSIRERRGFSHAHAMLEKHPDLFVLSNRFILGLRLIGGVTAGLSSIPFGRFLVLNALSAAVWAILFVAIGYGFGVGAEHLVGDTLVKHQKLVIGIGLACAVALSAWAISRHCARRHG